MINFLHTFNPSPILATIGPISVYWYGFFIMLGVLAGLAAAVYLARFHGIKSEIIVDLALWLIVGGIIGARIYDIGLEWQYFSTRPLDMIKIWQGGLAIHGAIIGGAAALWLFAKKYQYNFWQLAAVVITGLPLGQAIGRWGNYFNQELFGYPTSMAWGIPIDQFHRPWQYFNYDYFHPAFLYESLGSLIIFFLLAGSHYLIIKKNRADNQSYFFLLALYFLLYSSLRFFTEFIRIDATPVVFGLRFPQLASLLIIFLFLGYFTYFICLKIRENKALEK